MAYQEPQERIRALLKLRDDLSKANRLSVKKYIEAKPTPEADEFIHLNPRDFNAYLHRANMRYEFNQYLSSIDDYNQALKLNPRCHEAFYGRARSSRALMAYEYASVDCQEAIKLDIQNAQYYILLGHIQLDCAKYDLALSNYNQAILIEPEKANYYSFRGYLAIKQGKYNEAITDYEQALQLYKKVPESDADYKIIRSYYHGLARAKYALNKDHQLLDNEYSEFKNVYDHRGFSMGSIYSGVVAHSLGGDSEGERDGLGYDDAHWNDYGLNHEYNARRLVSINDVHSIFMKHPLYSSELLADIRKEYKQKPMALSKLEAKREKVSREYRSNIKIKFVIPKAEERQLIFEAADKRQYTLEQWEAIVKKEATLTIKMCTEEIQKKCFYPEREKHLDPEGCLHIDTGVLYQNYYQLRAQARTWIKEYESAIVDYNNAIQLDIKNGYYVGTVLNIRLSSYYIKLAEAKYHLKQYELAIADATEAISLSPRHMHAIYYTVRSMIKNGAGDFNGAIKDSQSALQLKLEYVPALKEQAFSKFRLKDHNGALANLNRALTLQPDYSDAIQLREEIQQSFTRPLASASSPVSVSSENPIALSVTTIDINTIIQTHMTQFQGSVSQQFSAMQKLLEDQSRELSHLKETQVTIMARQLAQQDALIAENRNKFSNNEIRITALLAQKNLQQGQHNSEVEKELSELRTKQAILWQEFEITQKVKAEQQYIAASPCLSMCYLRLQTKLNEFFMGMQAIASGQVQRSGTTVESVIGGINILSSFASFIPGVNMITTVMGKVVEVYQDKKMAQQATHISQLGISITRMDRLAEQLARLVALHYKIGLEQLMEQSAGNVGEWCVKPVIAYLYQTNEEHFSDEKDLIQKLFKTIKKAGLSGQSSQEKLSEAWKTFKAFIDKDDMVALRAGGQCSIKGFLKEGIKVQGQTIRLSSSAQKEIGQHSLALAKQHDELEQLKKGEDIRVNARAEAIADEKIRKIKEEHAIQVRQIREQQEVFQRQMFAQFSSHPRLLDKNVAQATSMQSLPSMGAWHEISDEEDIEFTVCAHKEGYKKNYLSCEASEAFIVINREAKKVWFVKRVSNNEKGFLPSFCFLED